MKLAKEPKEVDFIIQSEPWSEKDAADFTKLIKELKRKNKRKSISAAEPLDRKNSAKNQNQIS